MRPSRSTTLRCREERYVKMGVIIVDHGSKREIANKRLVDIVKRLKEDSKYEICEPAHMELAEPSIKDAYDRCVEQGAEYIVCHPYFLSKGKHYEVDIPALLEDAAKHYPSVKYILTDPLGYQEGIIGLMQKTINDSYSSTENII